MSTPISQKPRQLALVGNPNCGKTALFNRLTGARAKVANYPGVTVEKRIGRIGKQGDWLVDLPGSYSLFVASPDEEVARRLIMGELEGEQRPDALIAVVDACNIKLGLRLVLELQTLGMPMILALNMADEAQRRGIQIDTLRLSEQLHMPVVTTVAIRQQGTETLLKALETLPSHVLPQTIPDTVEACYAHIDTVLNACVIAPNTPPAWQDKLDRVLLHPIAGSLILLSILFLMFQAVFAWAGPLMDGIEAGIALLGEQTGQLLPEGILKEFMVNGLIAGTGSVLVFLPQILILFAFILALEDSGYLPRAAFLLDNLMRGVGLSGRSFIPMLSSFACAIPGIMSTRSIADPKERWLAIMVAPLMTCSARLPVYALVIGAFIPDTTVWGWFNLQGLTLFALYMAGIVSAALMAWIFRRQQTIESNGFPLLMELPSYRWPSAYHFVIGLKERAWVFIRRVGTIILALSIVLWFLSTYPAAPIDASAPAIEYSYAGMLGKFMAPLFEPLGFTWQMCIALIPAMAAREVAVSALATVYAVGEGDTLLGTALGQSWPLPVALAYLAWFVYAPQCLSTIAVVRRETNSIRSTTLFVFYLFAMAYVAAWLTRIIAS